MYTYQVLVHGPKGYLECGYTVVFKESVLSFTVTPIKEAEK